MVQRSSASGFDHHSSLSRRSELPPDDDDDTRDLGELILALKGDQSCHDIIQQDWIFSSYFAYHQPNFQPFFSLFLNPQ